MIRRDLYLNQILEFLNKSFIKVIYGIRRSGKSAILCLLKEELRKKDITEEFILHLNFGSFEFSEIDQSVKLNDYIKTKFTKNKRYHIQTLR